MDDHDVAGSEWGDERASLLAQNASLRGANEHLVVATLEAQKLREESDAANLRQNEFLAMLAHELRNPLAPISMAGAMLGKLPAPSPHVLQIKKIIDRQVGHLSQLLDDLLDAARINSGKISLVLRPVLVADQLANAVDTVRARLSARGQRLNLHVADEAILIEGDPVRLAQVFSNLLVNASKFTQDGGEITVTASVSDDCVQITVADNGAGIAPDVIPGIFALFTQGPRSLARSEGGLGVGLNIVRNVVEMHGGSVYAESPGLGRGSTFTLTLPLLGKAGVVEKNTIVDVCVSVSHHILVVEDNIDANDTLSMFLRSEGHTVVSAFDGIAGLAAAQEGNFHVIVCDIGLPGMDGYQLIRNLCSANGAALPFAIALSGYGQVEDRMRALAAGFNHAMVKPVHADELLRLIAAVEPIAFPNSIAGDSVK